jgi:hypothetical protein
MRASTTERRLRFPEEIHWLYINGGDLMASTGCRKMVEDMPSSLRKTISIWDSKPTYIFNECGGRNKNFSNTAKS